MKHISSMVYLSIFSTSSIRETWNFAATVDGWCLRVTVLFFLT